MQHAATRCPEGLQIEKELLKGKCGRVRHMLILNERGDTTSPDPPVYCRHRMRMMHVATALLLITTILCGQSTPGAPQARSQTNDSPLHDYESCTFDDGLQIVKVDSLPPGIQERSVDTKSGPKTIRMLAGRRIMFAYGIGGDFFANVKPEILPDDTWAVEKQALLDALDTMLSSSHDTLPDSTFPREVHGLEVRGFNRTALHGGTLGFYLIFDEARHIATSVYLLNQEPLTRRFQTIEQYRQLSSRFLKTYTNCIAQNQALHAPKDAK